MLNEERYRAALVALRDGQWEEAATHLLTLAADNPTYRGVDRVLEALQRTRSVSYWCAAFTIAREREAYAPARLALDQIAALAPSLPRLTALRQSLAEIAPPAERPTLLQASTAESGQPQDQAAATPEHPAASVDQEVEAAFDAVSDALHGLDLDPLTELLFDDRWVELSARPTPPAGSGGSPAPAVEKKAPGPAPMETHTPAAVSGSSQENSADSPVAIPHDDAAGAAATEAAPPQAEAADDTPAPSEAELVPLPAEPEGEFIRIVPLALETEEPAMATDTQTDRLTESQPQTEITTQHHYSALQLLGMLSFPLILLIVSIYVLFGQGAPTLLDMLREAQAGTAINTTHDLIVAIDTQLAAPDEMDSAERQLESLASLAEVLAEEAPELEAALSAWIATGRELAAARVTLAGACADPDAQACAEARQAVDALIAQAAEQRDSVCALTTCPAPQPDSVHS